MKAYLKNYRQSPRKVRLVANLVRGKNVDKARAILSFTDNKSASAIKKLIDSAVSSARAQGMSVGALAVKEIKVDEGMKMRRYMPMARGRANPYFKRSSHVTLVLGGEIKKEKVEKKATAKEAAKTSTQKRAVQAKKVPAKKPVAKKKVPAKK